MFSSQSHNKILCGAALFVVLATSSVLATISPGATANDVPFYIQQEEDALLVAVIQYGGDDEDDKKIRIPCYDLDHAAPSSTGPGVMICRDNGNGHYELRLPFRFVPGDEDGTIVGVEYDTVQIIPFRTVQDGTTIIGIVSDIPDLDIPFYCAGADPADDGDVGSDSVAQQHGGVDFYGKKTNKNDYDNEDDGDDDSMINEDVVVARAVVVVVFLLCLLLWTYLFCCGHIYKNKGDNNDQDATDNEEIVIEFYKCDKINEEDDEDTETDDEDKEADDDGGGSSATSSIQDH